MKREVQQQSFQDITILPVESWVLTIVAQQNPPLHPPHLQRNRPTNSVVYQGPRKEVKCQRAPTKKVTTMQTNNYALPSHLFVEQLVEHPVDLLVLRDHRERHADQLITQHVIADLRQRHQVLGPRIQDFADHDRPSGRLLNLSDPRVLVGIALLPCAQFAAPLFGLGSLDYSLGIQGGKGRSGRGVCGISAELEMSDR